MVITSTNSNDSTLPEPSEPVDEPPIRGNHDPPDEKQAAKPTEYSKGAILKAAGPLSREELSLKAHILDVASLAKQLGVVLEHGLTSDEAANRLSKDGPNKIKDTKGVSPFQVFLRQVSNSLTLVLIAVMVLSFCIHDYIEAGVVTAVIAANIVVGFIQDYRAEKVILSLQALSDPECKVLRDSRIQTIKAEHAVVGDIVHLSAGAGVTADLRLFDGMNLATDESQLTGESLPISKHHDKELRQVDLPTGDRVNMAYSGSIVTRGRGSGIVIATAMLTEVGKIATLTQKKNHRDLDTPSWKRFLFDLSQRLKHILGLVGSPMQVTLSKFALLLFALAILLAIIVFSVNKFDVHGEVLIYGICVAVAVIPESLIAVLTVTIAVGVKAMGKNNIVIRKLASLEAVGGVTNICSDKTGTLTQGKMIVRRAIVAGGNTLVVNGTSDPFDPASGSVIAELNDASTEPNDSPAMSRFLDIVSLCNLSTVQELETSRQNESTPPTSQQKKWTGVGEPTEIALSVFAMRFNHSKAEAMANNNRKLINEFGFDSSIKRMTMVYTGAEDKSVDFFTKGAMEALLPILNCADDEKAQINRDAEQMASQGLRVLCLGYKHLADVDEKELAERDFAEADLTFAGLVGLCDPPRVETKEAVRTCKRAGIEVHMLTGDHIRTAAAIAAEVGIIDLSIINSPLPTHRAQIMAASDFDKLTDTQIDQLDILPLVIARCSPATKVRMVEALHRRKKFCIMTGDGINDAPALQLADIGIAMGLNGSDVAKQAADMVLADDDFASIVAAIQEGRRLFDNIQKFLLHLLTSNIAQVILLLIALSFKDTTSASISPLSPLEILWANLVTSSPLAIGLGLEPAAPNIMSRPPRASSSGVFTYSLIRDKMVYGIAMGSLCLVAFVSVAYGLGEGELGVGCNEEWNETCDVVFRARATVFAVLTGTLVLTAWEVRDFNLSLFNMGFEREGEEGGRSRWEMVFSVFPTLYQNVFLFWACVSGFVTLFALVYIPGLNTSVFKHRAIGVEWGIVLGCLVVYMVVIEAWKAVKRRMARKERGLVVEGSDDEKSVDGTETAVNSPDRWSVV